MAEMTTIDIDCWICGDTFYVPARLTLLSPRYITGPWYGKQVSANFWAYVEMTEINRHVAQHWPMLVVGFYLWRAYVDVTGIDPLAYYR